MSLEKVLKKAVERIRSGKLESEAQRKQAVILPILRALDWDDADPDEFKPEFSVAGGNDPKRWVDYALLRKGGVPLVFIEAKAPGKADSAGEEQVFQYAYGQGVPFLILTDGDIWNFYLTTAFGPPADRRFYRAELTSDARIPDYVKFFEEYLLKSCVVSGAPLDAARIRHESVFERNRACKAIPGAWRKLLETPDDSLRALLIENTEKDCGARPDVDDVDDFLQAFLGGVDDGPAAQKPPASASTTSGETEKSGVAPAAGRKSTIIGFILDGKRYDTRTGKRTLSEILKEFDRRASAFMENFAAQTATPKKRLVARNREDLYIGSPHLIDSSMPLENGWWLATINNTTQIRQHIQTACEVAGVKFDSQLRLIER